MKRLKDLFASRCEHDHQLVVTTAGVKRSVCEQCGHLSFEMIPTPVSERRAPKSATRGLRKVSGL